MADRMRGRVALVTGAARGQGRSHAVRLAQEGANIIGLDICGPVGRTADYYPPPGEADLAETASLVAATGMRMLAVRADVRSLDEVQRAVMQGVQEFGSLDTVVANAGIHQFGDLVENTSEESWRDVLAVNVDGVFLTCKAAIPYLSEEPGDRSIVIISSTAGVKGFPHIGHYTASKHAVIGLMRSLALELGPRGIRVNAIAPTTVDTVMVQNDGLYRLYVPDKANPTREDFARKTTSLMALPIPWAEPVDVSNAVLFLASEEARCVTGHVLAVDAGALAL
jgi:(+)-trans-carveol dehydrogenase